MVHDISIAPAAPADVEAVRSISAAAYTPAYLAAIGAVPKPATEDYVPRIALKQVWILAVAGRPAGLIVLEPVGGDLLIYSVAVHPDHQGHGFAKELIAFAGERAKLGGCGTLRLYTNARMLRNVALYRACGFAETGRRPHPSRPGETLIDMAKQVAPALSQP